MVDRSHSCAQRLNEEMEREDKKALIIGTLMVAVAAALFVFPLPPSPTFFDGLGRIFLMYGMAAVCIWMFMARGSRTFQNVMFGSLTATFLGTVIGVILTHLFDAAAF